MDVRSGNDRAVASPWRSPRTRPIVEPRISGCSTAPILIY